MAVRFILGTSGTGKTSRCIAAIAKSLLDPTQTHPLILLVPEQATYQAERAILAVEGIGGYSRLQVLSFSRLEFMLEGRYTAGTELSRIAQQLIIHRILRHNEKSLRIFGASARHPGLAAQIAQTIVELHQYAQSAETIQNLATELAKTANNSVTSLKFSDIALIYSEYLKCVEAAFVNPDIQLSTAAKAVADAAFLKGAHLWVDGFSGFTAQELAMLRELLKVSDESYIALCLDPEPWHGRLGHDLVAWPSRPCLCKEDAKTEEHGRDAHATGEGHGRDAHATLKKRYGSYLPHWTKDDSTYFVTFRLSDSLPAKVVEKLKFERKDIIARAEQNNRTLSSDERARLHYLYAENIDKYLDTGIGECSLKREAAAQIVADALRYFDGQRYHLVAWCVMPNHVHVVVRPFEGHRLEDIIHSWKSFTSHKVNTSVGRAGSLWQPEYYDHLIRNESEFVHLVEYTLSNPEKAGLKNWRWFGTGSQPNEEEIRHGRDAHATGLDPLSIFSPTERTWVALTEMVKKNNLKLAEPLLLQKPLRFSSSPQLAHIEKNLFKDEPVRIEAGEAVQIVAAANARAEVEYVARRIAAMVREQNLRYRDIAVVVSDLGGYRHYIQAAFEDCAIPFFIDMAKPVNQHPIVEVILSAIAVVVNGFESSDVFAFLKTDLSPLKRDEADVLENYCLAKGIDGKHWKQTFDDDQAGQIRTRAIAPLIDLESKFGNEKTITAVQFRKTIDEFLQTLNVNEKFAAWEKEHGRDAHATDKNADEHRQFARQLAQLFDELAQVFGGEVLPLEDFASLLTRAFEQMSLRLIPPSLDQVLVGSIERSRHPDLKAIFLLGASQKQFPVPVRFDSILTDDDRATAEAAGCELAETTAMQLTQRQYLVYIAFTRPSHLLCVSYPTADDKGSELPPSPFVANLQLLFVDLKPLLVGYESLNATDCVNEHELADVLCVQLGADTNGESVETQNFASLLKLLLADKELANVGKTVMAAVGYENTALLDKDFTAGLFAGELKSSITKLGSFASCPYQYFAKYTLQLKERDIYSFEPPDLGEFYHKALCELFKRLAAAKTNVAVLNEEELFAYLRDATAAVITEDNYYTGFMSRSRFNTYIIETAIAVLEDFVRDMSQMTKAGRLRQVAAEMSIEYRIRLSDKRELLLRGYIDRVDVADDGTNAAVVFDYKSSERSFSWQKCYYGLDLQMLFYMLAIDGKKIDHIENVHPIGAFYMPIDIGTQKTDIDKIETHAEKFLRKAKGVFNGEYADSLDSQLKSKWSSFYNYSLSKDDGAFGNYVNSGVLKPEDFQKILVFAKAKVVELAKRIIAGDIVVRPYRLGRISPCSMCEFMSLCRFDWHINDYNFMESLNKTAVLEKIGGNAGGR